MTTRTVVGSFPVFDLVASTSKIRERRKAAFSLVEVTLAIGIVSFALLSLLGVVPVGLSALRSAMDCTVEAQITQKISGEALLTPFSLLEDRFSGKTFFFDEEGNAQTSQAEDTRYSLTAAVVNNPLYPGSDNLLNNSSLKCIQLEMVTAPSRSAAQKQTNYYNILVPNSGI